MTRVGVVSISLLLGFSLIAAACGSDDDGGDGVTIGVIVPLTGELAWVGEPTAAQFEFAAGLVNASGLNPCGDITLVIADQGNPEDAIRAARQMIDNDNVVAIVGPTSDGTVAIADLAQTEQVVLMSPYAGTVTLDELGGDFVYRAVPSDTAGGTVAAAWISERGYQSPAYMILNEESPLSLGELAISKVEASGIATAAEVTFNPGQPSYQAELTEILDADADVILLAGGLESGSTVITEAHTAGYTGDWYLTSDMASQDVIDTVGADIMGGNFYGAIPNPDETRPEYAHWLETFEAAGGEAGPYRANSFDVITTLALAMTGPETGCDGAAINANMRAVTAGGTPVSTYEVGATLLLAGKDIDYNGASGPLAFDESGTPPGSFSVLQVQNGEWESVKFYPATTFIE